MLRSRILTSLILAPIFIFALIKLDMQGFAILCGVILAAAGWEWAGLSGLNAVISKLGFLFAVAGTMATAPWWAGYALDWLPYLTLAWWLSLGFCLRQFPDKLLMINYPVAVKLSIGWFVLVSGWMLLVWLRGNFSVEQTLYLFLLVWLADISAYGVGKLFGNTKLLPQISPSKTSEGLYGALFIVGLFAVSVGLYKQLTGPTLVDFIGISIIAALTSVFSDLFESLAKRVKGVKDSGAILPGHGGILDRVDSLMGAVSAFYVGCMLRGIFL